MDAFTFPKGGVKLSYIVNEFIGKCGGIERVSDLSSAQVCEQFIKPFTYETKSSYCDFLKQQQQQQQQTTTTTKSTTTIGETADVFISHAHACNFLDMINALQYTFRNKLDTVLWLDLFTINQHEPMDWTFEWLSTTFMSSIQQIGHTVVVFTPWNDPIPFQRAWCIFEAYSTAIVEGNKYEIAMGEKDRKQFIKDLMEDSENAIDQMLATIQAQKCQCSKQEDREKIFSVIQSSPIGFQRINSIVFEQYRNWVITVALEALDEEEQQQGKCNDGSPTTVVDTIIKLKEAIAGLYLGQGKYEQAQPYYQESYKQLQLILGESHQRTLYAMHNLARLYYNQGQYKKAKPLYVACLETQKSILGVDHPNTLATMNNLGVLYKSEGESNKALSLYVDCLEKRKVVLGTHHPNTLRTMNNLAILYKGQGQYNQALPLYMECLKTQQSLFGENHPDALAAMNNLAVCYKSQGEYDRALPLYLECWEKQTSVLGENHPDTLTTMNNLAWVYHKMNDSQKALSLYVDCFHKCKVVLGENHPDTLATMYNLALLYGSYQTVAEDSDTALSLCRECFEKYKSIHGENHLQTLTMMDTVASVYDQQGNCKKAISMYTECLDKKKSTLGEHHTSTIHTREQLSKLCSKQVNEHPQNHTNDDNKTTRGIIVGGSQYCCSIL